MTKDDYCYQCSVALARIMDQANKLFSAYRNNIIPDRAAINAFDQATKEYSNLIDVTRIGRG